MLLKSYNYRPGKIIYDGKDDDFMIIQIKSLSLN